jgi:2-polyprenyl-3-methyl-5-hydroxy-6-metoxy-1,4-benzoquinol methylase
MKKILQFIEKKIFPQKDIIIPKEFKTEDDYYTFFFTKHPKWSKPEPNKAELARLVEIDKMMQIIVDAKTAETTDIIDFGCGRGWLANKLSKYGSVLGIEPVQNVVNYAKKLYPNISFEVGSIEKLLNKQVDVIVASEVIEHFKDEDKLKYFTAFNKVLKLNGYCLITTPRAEVQKEWLSYRKDSGQPVENWLTEFQVEELAKLSGFSVEEKIILQERANDSNSPLLNLYQIWLFKKYEH